MTQEDSSENINSADEAGVMIDVLSAIRRDRTPEDCGRHVANLQNLIRSMRQYGNQRDDPVRTVPAYLGDRWSSLILHLLHGGMLRHTELKRLITLISAEHEISQRVLTLKLRMLERDGMVLRTVTKGTPARVEYHLTEIGSELYQQFMNILRWAEKYSKFVRNARAIYDQEHPDSGSYASDD